MINRRILVLSLTFVSYGVFASVASAAVIGQAAGPVVPATIVTSPSPSYGLASSTAYVLQAHDLVPPNNTTAFTYTIQATPGVTIALVQTSAGGGNQWWGEARLPSGASLQSVELEACDTTATGDIGFGMTQLSSPPGGATQNITPVGTTGTAATPACGKFSIAPLAPVTIDNANFRYVVFVDFNGVFDPSLQFLAIRIFYKLQVSPGPPTATFGDVPTSAGIFKFVEALAASGITAGCGNGNYCPNDPVTRGQMAVFLSAALGLHWTP